MHKNKKNFFPKKTEYTTKSDKRNEAVTLLAGQKVTKPIAKITVRREYPAALEVESQSERERTLQVYATKRSVIKAKMKNPDGEWRALQMEQK